MLYKNMEKKLYQNHPNLISYRLTTPTMRNPTQPLHQSRTTTHNPGVVKLLRRQCQGIFFSRSGCGRWEVVFGNGKS